MIAIEGESATVGSGGGGGDGSGDGYGDGTTAGGSEVASTSGTPGVSQYPVHSLPIEGCVYRGEGNANLVVAVPSERKVIRLRKSAVTTTDHAAGDVSSADTQLQQHRQHEEERRIRREVEFVRGVISGYLGAYARAPEVRRYAGPEIARLADKIRSERPENRRDKEIVGGWASVYPDYALLPAEEEEVNEELLNRATFCVEIKPKQGFVCKADRQLPKCPYCLTQFYKVRRGSVDKTSAYCPLDLYSGDPRRMDRALEGLLANPQNNLKIFKDGRVVYGEKRSGEETLQRVLADWFGIPNDHQTCLQIFKKLIRSALTRKLVDDDLITELEVPVDFKQEVPSRLRPGLLERTRRLLNLAGAEECNMLRQEDSCLSVGSVVERILRMQRVHHCGADVVSWIYAKLGPYLDDELIYADLEKNCQDVQRGVEAKINQLEQNKKKQSSNVDNCLKTEQEKVTNNHPSVNLLTDDCIKILKNYLLFVTARDCSILMAFKKIDKKLLKSDSFSRSIIISEDQCFLVSVRVLDLDTKSLACIDKHRRRDNDILEAVLKVLEQCVQK